MIVCTYYVTTYCYMYHLSVMLENIETEIQGSSHPAPLPALTLQQCLISVGKQLVGGRTLSDQKFFSKNITFG